MGLLASDESAIIEMAWDDRVPFEAIEHQFGLKESGVIALMRSRLKPKSFRVWRERVYGRHAKHSKLKINLDEPSGLEVLPNIA